MALGLGQIEIRSRATLTQGLGVVEQVQTEVDEGTRHLRSIHLQMLFVQMPAAGPHDERGNTVLQAIRLAFRRVVREMLLLTASRRLTCPSITLAQVGVSESSQSAMNTFAPEFNALMIIFAIGGPGDFNATVLQIGRDRRHLPVAVPDSLRVCGKKSGNAPAVSSRRSLFAALQKLRDSRRKTAMQLHQERLRVCASKSVHWPPKPGPNWVKPEGAVEDWLAAACVTSTSLMETNLGRTPSAS